MSTPTTPTGTPAPGVAAPPNTIVATAQDIQNVLGTLNHLAEMMDARMSRVEQQFASMVLQAQEQAQAHAQAQAQAQAHVQAPIPMATSPATQGQRAPTPLTYAPPTPPDNTVTFNSYNAPTQNRALPIWKVPSVNAPTFDGKVRERPAHEAQAVIDNYLHEVKSKAAVYGFRGDNEPERGVGHVTYAQWAALGLTGSARHDWRRVPEATRNQYTWAQYSDWIRTSFSSPLTLTQALDSLMQLKQKSAATAYSQRFNELVAAIESTETNPEIPQVILCAWYRNGLKPQLAKEKTLFEMRFDLVKLQREAERMDDINWRISPRETYDRVFDKRPPPRPNPNQRRVENRFESRPFRQQFDASGAQRAERREEVIPMDLDNLERRFQPLSEAERKEYERRGWCKFCRQKDHTIEKCKRRQEYNEQKSKARVFNLETNEELEPHEPDDDQPLEETDYLNDDLEPANDHDEGNWETDY